LSTSVVDVLYPELATVLSGSREAAPTLRELAQASVFVDMVAGGGRDGGEAYAYHPLVRDLLRAQLRHQSPTRTRRLHRKAARWLAESGRTSEAIRQFAAAEDWEEAAQLLVVEHGVGRLIAAGPGDGLAETFARLPVTTGGPAVAVARAALAVHQGDLVAADKQLARAGELVTDSTTQGVALQLAVGVTRMIRAALGGDAQEALSGATLVQSLAAEPGAPCDPDVAALALIASARGGFLLGELPFAREMFASVVTAVPAERNPVLRGYALAQLALVEATAGHLAAAVDAAAEALDVGGTVPGAGAAPLGTCAGHVALAWVAADRGDLDDAGKHVRVAQAEGSGGLDPVASAALVLVRSRLLRLGGHLPAALRLLRHWGDRLSASTPSWLCHRLEAAEARVLLEEGRRDEAESLVRRPVSQGSLECLLAHGWIKLAGDGATESWRTARQASRQSDAPVELLVEANLLAAASAVALSRGDAAALAVDEALRLASAEGLRRPLDEAPLRVRALIDQRRHRPQADAPAAPPPVLSVPTPRSEVPALVRGAAPGPRPDPDVIIQPLTKREAEVLAYLDQLLPTEEIAARMYLSVNTIKTHVRAILRKLAAERRNDAVRRARDLGLL
jgi:LuxR family maltose regulon positive regulatory protein